jgi:phage tail tape-measure protein
MNSPTNRQPFFFAITDEEVAAQLARALTEWRIKQIEEAFKRAQQAAQEAIRSIQNLRKSIPAEILKKLQQGQQGE